MKIKCPGCASVLEIPETAAGKVVKCKCGKQLRAPAPKGAANSATQPARKPPAGAPAKPRVTTQASAAAPVPYSPFPAPAPAGSGGIFDELTESDLSPVKAVQVPGARVAVKPPNANAAKMLNEAISGSDRRGQGLVMQGESPRPPFLIFIGVINGLAALFYAGLMVLFIGLVDMVPAVEDSIPEVVGVGYYIVAGMFGLMATLSIATCISCFIRGRVTWYIVLISYGWALAFRIFEVVQQAMSDDVDIGIMKGVGGILVGAGIWAWLHSERVRAYYQTEAEPIWRIAVMDATGFLIAGCLGAAALLLA